MLFPVFVFAQHASDSIQQNLKEINIVATKTEKNKLETGRSVTVLTQKDLQGSVYSTLAELLSNQEGIYITGNSQTPGTNESIFMRGSNSNQTAIFVDGIRINDGSTVNNTIDLTELPLGDVERIEIIRGSHSTLFGSSAIGGVIQISTFKPEKEGLNARINVSAGTFEKDGASIFPSASVGYKFKNGFYLSASGNFQQVNGLDATVDTITDPFAFKNRDRDDWTKSGAAGQLGYAWKKGDASISFRNAKMKTDIDRSAFVDDENYKLDFERNSFMGNFNINPIKKLEIFLSGGYTRNTRHAINDSSIMNIQGGTDHSYAEDRYESENISSDLFLSWKEKNIVPSIGISYQEEKMNQSNYFYSTLYAPFITDLNTNLDSIHPETRTNSIYAQLELSGALLNPKLQSFKLILGARRIQHSKFGNEFVWEVNPTWQLSNNSLIYFSYSKGFNAPSLYQLYAPDLYFRYDDNSTTGISRGNDQLLPEVSESYEFGLKQKIDGNGFFGLSFFKSITSDQIDYVYLWNQGIPIDQLGTDFNRDDYRGDLYLNTGKQTTYGLEFSFENKINEFIKLHFNLSIVNGYLDYIESETLKNQTGGNTVQIYNNGAFLNTATRTQGLTRRPNTARTEIHIHPIENLKAIFGLNYVGSRGDVHYDSTKGPFGALSTSPVNDYILLDFSIGYSFTSKISSIIKLENILNENYYEIKGFSTRGRGLYFKVSYVL